MKAQIPQKLFVTLFALFLLAFAPAAWANIITSTATGGLWSAPGTWVGGAVPSGSDDVVIATTTGNKVTLDINTNAVNVTINANATLGLGADNTTGRTLTITGNLANYGAIAIGTGAGTSPTQTLTFGGPACLWTGSGDLSSFKCKVTINGSSSLDISGLTTALKFRPSGGTVGNTSSGTLVTGTQVINGNANSACSFTFNSGSSLVTANPNGIVGALATFNFNGAVAFKYGSSVTFNGTAGQITTGLTNLLTSLIINNSGAGVTLSQATTVTNLTLTAGKLITTAANLLTVTNGGTGISGGSASSYVSGPLAQAYGAAGSKTFPVGLNSNCRPVSLNITTLSGAPTITVTPHEPTVFGGAAPAGYTAWTTRDWTVASSVASGNVGDLTVDGTDFTPSGGATLLDYNGTTAVALTTGFSSPNYLATSISLTASSDFALGCAAPTSPTITSVSAPVCSPVEVDWGPVSGASSYNVYRKLSGGSYGSALATGQTGTSYFDPTAAVGSTYVYAVTAMAACGAESATSADSNPVSPTGAPFAPAITSVTPGCGSLTVNWGTVSGDTGGYNIYRKLSGGSYGAAIANVPSGTGTCLDSGANDSTKTYVYAVTAVGSCESTKSTDSTGASPTNPGITASPISVTTVVGYGGTFNVSATGAGLTYQWQVSTDNGTTWNNVTDGTGGTTANYTTIAATAGMSGYQYHCVVSGTCSPPSVTSGAAALYLATHFRSAASGVWTSTAWEISYDGSTGWMAAPAGAFPGASNTMEVRATHSVTNADNSTNYAAAVTIDSGGTLYLNSQGSVTTSAGSWLQIGGNLVNNGTITGFSPANGNQNYIVFTGNASWTGSASAGDLSGAKIDVWVTSGVTLTLGCDIALRGSTSKANLRIYGGRLNAGAHKITQGGSSGSSFTLAAGSTLETANAGGIGGTGASSGTWQSAFGAVSFDPTATIIFDGTTAQTAGSGFPATFQNLAINNTGGVGANTVTLPATAISGTLYIQSGLLSFGATTTSTAGALTFDGSAYQATGTWGSPSSMATHQDGTRFADNGYVMVAGPVAVSSSTQFRSHVTGNWNVAGTWEASADSGASWSSLITGFTPGTTPGSTHTVLIQSPHTVTLTEAEACGTLTVNSGGTLSVTNQALTLANAPALNGALRITANKTGANTFNGGLVTQSAGTLTYGGTLSVTSIGLALANNDVLPLFSASAYAGSFTTVTGPTTLAGLTRNISQLTNNPATGGNLAITCDGTLAVTLASQVNVNTCHGDSSGSITANAATGGSGANYTYSIDGVTYQTSLVFSSLAAGSYTLTAKDGEGCVSAGVPVTISQPTAVVASAGAAAAICLGGSTQIGGSPTASGGTPDYTYAWSDGSAVISTASNPTVAPTATTTYTVTVKDAGLCTAQSQVTVTVNPPPATAVITGPGTVNANETGVHYAVTLTSGSSYAWTVPTGASITSGTSGSNNNEIVVTFGTSGGNVAVIETSAAGCAGSQVSLAVTVQNLVPVTITGIAGTTLTYTGGSGTKFILLSSPSVDAALSSWSRVDTNSASPGTFTIPAIDSSAQLFYSIRSE